MNQQQLADRSLAILISFNERNPDAWYPAHGWVSDDGEAFGLAVEILGSIPRRVELEKLAKALYRLAAEDVIEVALFRRSPLVHRLPSRPFQQGGHVHFGMIGVGSQKLKPGPNEYAVRLLRDVGCRQ